jgi:transposase
MRNDGGMAKPVGLILRPGDRVELEARERSNVLQARDVQRARLVLLAAQGVSDREIATRIDMHYNQVAVWRRRYATDGLAGLVDGERPGRAPIYGHDVVLRIVKTVTETPPDGTTRWSMAAIAAKLSATDRINISASQVWRICQSLDLKPWQTKSWMTSHDPDFWEKAADVCGLYLDPPTNAVVWSVDEKTGMQAKSRVNPTKPAIPGSGVRQEFEYRRYGTAVLFAGLNVHTGEVAGKITDSSRSVNFVEFLTELDARTPKRLELHCIVDNLKTHGTDKVEAFLDDHPRVFLHNTPTHASWLNQVEMFFSIMQRRLLRSGEFNTVDDLGFKVIEFIKHYNRTSKPFRWTYDARPLRIA